MALVKGTNVYADDAIAAADAYFAEHIYAADWSAMSTNDKTNCLVSGTAILDRLGYSGMVRDVAQSLAFPRTGSYFDTRKGTICEFDSEDYPKALINASFEMALHLKLNPDLLKPAGSVENLEVEGISLENIKQVQLIPNHVYDMIRPFISKSNRAWWRAN